MNEIERAMYFIHDKAETIATENNLYYENATAEVASELDNFANVFNILVSAREKQEREKGCEYSLSIPRSDGV